MKYSYGIISDKTFWAVYSCITGELVYKGKDLPTAEKIAIKHSKSEETVLKGYYASNINNYIEVSEYLFEKKVRVKEGGYSILKSEIEILVEIKE